MSDTPEIPAPAERPPLEGLTVLIAGPAWSDEQQSAWQEMLNATARPHELIWLDAPLPSGLGDAFRTGIERAQYPLILFVSLDYPYTPTDVPAMLERIAFTDPESGRALDLINGCRAARPVPLLNRWLGKAWRGMGNLLLDLGMTAPPGHLDARHRRYRFLYHMLFGLRVVDPMSGMKLFRRALLPRIPLQSQGSFVWVEMLAKANFLGAFMDELPIATEAGQTNPPLPAWGPIRADLMNLLGKPDFGPPFLPASPPSEVALHADTGH